MSLTLIIGVDPGPVPGIVGLLIRDGKIENVDTVQVNHDLIRPAVEMLVEHTPHHQRVIAVEKFVVGRRAGRSSTPKAGAITRDMVGVVVGYGEEIGSPVIQETAARVKGWATDERLARAGIKTPTGMRHAKDAARHALFAAVNHGYLPDPMSKAAR